MLLTSSVFLKKIKNRFFWVVTGVEKRGKLKIKKHTHDSGASLLSQQSLKSFEIGDYLFISWPRNLIYKLKLRSPYIARLKQAKNYQ